MSTRGQQMLARVAALDRAAERTPGKSTDICDEPASAGIQLSMKAAGLSSIPFQWDHLARMQPEVDESVLTTSKQGDVFALEDRNIMSMPWRRIFAVRDGDFFVIFDEKGQLIVEEHDGLPNGRQRVAALVEEFSKEGFYYKPPTGLRPTPTQRRDAAAARRRAAFEKAEANDVAERNDLLDALDAASDRFDPNSSGETGTQAEDALADCSAILTDIVTVVLEGEGAVDAVALTGGEQHHREDNVDSTIAFDSEHPRTDETSDVEVADSVDASLEDALQNWEVGERVELVRGDGCLNRNGGMVADVSASRVLVARDDGRWIELAIESASNSLISRRSCPVPPMAVVEILCSRPGVVAGMLVAAPRHPEIIWGDLVAYGAYIAYSSSEFNHRLRDRQTSSHQDAGKRSFAAGDILQQTNVPDGVKAARAAVVRVVFRKGTSGAQARKLLILFEMLCDDVEATPSEEPQFFPASWSNWCRTSRSDVDAEANLDLASYQHQTVELDELKAIDQEFHVFKPWDQKNMTTLTMALKYAAANLTPSQRRELDATAAKARREKAEAKAKAAKEAAAAKRRRTREAALEARVVEPITTLPAAAPSRASRAATECTRNAVAIDLTPSVEHVEEDTYHWPEENTAADDRGSLEADRLAVARRGGELLRGLQQAGVPPIHMGNRELSQMGNMSGGVQRCELGQQLSSVRGDDYLNVGEGNGYGAHSGAPRQAYVAPVCERALHDSRTNATCEYEHSLSSSCMLPQQHNGVWMPQGMAMGRGTGVMSQSCGCCASSGACHGPSEAFCGDHAVGSHDSGACDWNPDMPSSTHYWNPHMPSTHLGCVRMVPVTDRAGAASAMNDVGGVMPSAARDGMHAQRQQWQQHHSFYQRRQQQPCPRPVVSAHVLSMQRTYASLLAAQAMNPTSQGQMQIAQLRFDLDLENEQQRMHEYSMW